MNYSALRTELTTDPLARGYAAMTDDAAAADLNSTATGRTAARTRVEGRELLNAIDNAGWPTTGTNQDKLGALLNVPYIDASNVNTRGLLTAIFPNAGQTAATYARLVALATVALSRADELGLGGVVTALDVNKARAGVW